jgi:LysM repeat protein
MPGIYGLIKNYVMKFSFNTALLIILGLIAPLLVPARDYYIIYEKSCMDRLEYGYGFTPQDQNYVKYHIRINPTEILVLEVGTEDDAPTQSYLSSSTVSCGNEILNRSLLDKVRGGQDQVFMVQPAGTRYKISKVNMASYWKRDDRGLVYDSWQFSFNYLGSLTPGKVLTNDPSKGIKVTYEGMSPYKCTDAFLFRMTFLNGSSSYRDIFLIPGLGVAEERPNSGSPDDIYKLRNVNNEPFDTYIQKVCNSGSSGSESFLANNHGSQGSRGITTPRVVPTPTQTASEYHEVEKGETLYSISRQYGVNVEQLRQWNDLGNSNLLQVGDRLRVSSSQGSASTELAGDLPLSAQGSFGFSDNGSGQPNMRTSNGRTQTRGGSDARFAWQTTDGTHTVKSGETVALLAMRYGYTEARFRDMNNLEPNEMIKVGQQLKTTDCQSTGQVLNRSYLPGDNSTSGTSSTAYDSWSRPAPYDSPIYSSGATNEFTARSGASTFPGRDSGTERPSYSTPSSSFEPYASNNPDFSNLSSGQREVPSSYDTPSYYSSGTAAMRNGQGSVARTIPEETVPQTSSHSFGTPVPQAGSSVVIGQNTYSPYDQPERYRAMPQTYNTSDQTSRSSPPQVYIVREGDTIERIAQRFNTTPERIRQLNDLEARAILIPYTRLYID